MKTAIFSDLDRTVLFSDRFIGTNYSSIIPKNMIAVEMFVSKKGSTHTGYMNRQVFQFIKDNNLFIPVTARSIKRFLDIKDMENKEYAITSCGGYILYKGEIDKEYRATLNINQEELNEIANRLNGGVVDKTYVYTKIYDWFIIKEYINRYQCLFDEKGGLTILPKGVNKENAIKYLVKKLGIKKTICCGDSELDIGMLSIADIKVIPSSSPLSLLGYKDCKIYNTLSDDIIKYVK